MITVVIITKNEESNLQDCIDSISWCDEILIVDDDSTDQTIAIAKKNNAIIYRKKLNSDFGQQRNYAISKAKHEWVLFVDADERISSSLQYEILSQINNTMNQLNGYFLKRIDNIWGRKINYGENGAVSLLRLGRKDKGKWVGTVHEVWKIKGKSGRLINPIEHYPHKDISTFLKKINYYSDIRAQELYSKKVKTNMAMIAVYPVAKFKINYFLKQGIRDGVAGIVLAILMSFHSFLVRGKLWLLWQNT